MNKSKLRLESLEARIVMTVPTVASFSAVDSALEVGAALQLQATVNDVENDVQRVEFFLDDGDGVFDAAVDQLVATDEDASDGWQALVQTAGPYRIMPLGDSITGARTPYNSYRYPLAEKLDQANYSYDFVGSSNGPNSELFDADHEGHWGWRAEQILDQLPGWLSQNTPDIVLLHLGTNDALNRQSVDSTMAELGAIVDTLRQANPNVTIMTSLLISTIYEWNDRVEAINAELPAMVEQWNTADSPVILVDQNAAIDPETHLYDGVHPNELGEGVMADVWFEQIEMARPLADPESSFEQGSHTLFAIATDSDGTTSDVSRTRITIGEVVNHESIVGLNASQELWVARSNGTTLDTAFGGAWANDASFSHVADGDVNGDGYGDLIGRQTNGRLKIALGNRSGGFSFADWGNLTNVVSWSEFHVADFNGDGMDDFAARAASDGTWWVGESTGSSFSNSYWAAFRFPLVGRS